MIKRLIAAFLIGGASFAALNAVQVQADNSSRTFREFDQLVEVFERIRGEYVEPVEENEMIEAAINGMLSSLDPHSSYMGPDTYRAMQVQTEGEYGGLGIEVTMRDGMVLVVAPIDDTPAARAGVESGDLISHIDGEPVMGLNQAEAIEQMRGPVNTPIVITVIREGVEEPFDITIVRDVIKVRSVRHRVEDGIGYIRISTFNRQAADGLKSSIRELQEEVGDDLVGIILDLRGNPGGLLDQAVEIADAFLDHGEIVSTRGRQKADIERYSARSGDIVDGLPVIVLMNAYSASASEIVAGALQDHRRGIVLGTQSFGKGTVQTIIPLGPESAMRLTTARYYTPSGRSIQEKGIAPDITVLRPPEPGEEDDARPTPRREADLPNHIINESGAQDDGGDGEELPFVRQDLLDENGDPVEDYQLRYAIELMKSVQAASTRVALN